jgi:hypothetical protein
MADAKLSALTELTAAADADELYIRDESEASADESKRITAINLVKLRSTVANEARAGSAASGNVSYTGAGFAPTAVIIVGQDNQGGGPSISLSWGFGDDAAGERLVELTDLASTPESDVVTSLIVSTADNGNSQKASLDSLDSDGLTLAWTKGGSGQNCDFIILYLR